MTRKKPPPTASLVRSSAAEYLTFVAASGTGGVEAVYADENVWLSQKMMGQLYDVDVRTINYHLKTIFSDSELQEDAVIQNFRITAADGKSYDTKHYNLSATFVDRTANQVAGQVVDDIERRMMYVNHRYLRESVRDRDLRDTFQEFDEDACTWRP